MSAAFFLYTTDEKKPDLVTRDGGEAIGAFLQAVMEGNAEHVRLDWSA